MQILLDYFFKITAITPTPAASTAFLKQACIVVNPNGGGTAGDLTLCTTKAEVAAVTDNTEADELFDAGMSKVYVLQSADLDLATVLDAQGNQFYTLIVSNDFTDANVDSADFGTFDGVVAKASTSEAWAKAFNTAEKRSGWFTKAENGAKNMAFAFGKMLSNSLNWANQQYITMPYDDDVNTLGKAELYFDDKTSFVLTDSEFGKRLGFFGAGGKAIVAPYIIRNLEIDLQSKALQYISGNQPQYTVKHATLIEDELQKVIQSYINRQWIEGGTIDVKLEQDNFVASGYINVTEPNAMWRIFGELKQTLEV